MDSSGSIGASNFTKMQEFVIKIFQNLELGSNRTRVALLNFNSNVFELFNFLNFNDITNIKNIIQQINYNGGSTNTAGALKTANEDILQENNGMRPGQQNI